MVFIELVIETISAVRNEIYFGIVRQTKYVY